MANKDFSYVEDLNQLQSDQLSILERIEAMKDRSSSVCEDDLEAIRKKATEVLLEIDEIRHRASGSDEQSAPTDFAEAKK